MNMSDLVDDAQKHIDAAQDEAIRLARRRAAMLPIAVPGDCDICGEYNGSLRRGVCPPCLDKWKDRIHDIIPAY